MRKGLFVFSALLGAAALAPFSAWTHCEIPCGIYDDELRFDLLAENITTIEKSMRKAEGMERTGNQHQLIRWISNKEDHAGRIQDIVTRYFLTQRVKPVEKSRKAAFKKYQAKLILLHEMLFYASKAKQGANLSHVEKLRALLKEFRIVYFGPAHKKHKH